MLFEYISTHSSMILEIHAQPPHCDVACLFCCYFVYFLHFFPLDLFLLLFRHGPDSRSPTVICRLTQSSIHTSTQYRLTTIGNELDSIRGTAPICMYWSQYFSYLKFACATCALMMMMTAKATHSIRTHNAIRQQPHRTEQKKRRRQQQVTHSNRNRRDCFQTNNNNNNICRTLTHTSRVNRM